MVAVVMVEVSPEATPACCAGAPFLPVMHCDYTSRSNDFRLKSMAFLEWFVAEDALEELSLYNSTLCDLRSHGANLTQRMRGLPLMMNYTES